MAKKLHLFFLPVFWLLLVGMTYGQCPDNVSVTLNTERTICEGTSVTFTASVQDNTTYDYQWKINGAGTGTDNYTFTPGTLKTGDEITVTLTGADGCSTTSTPISMVVNPIRTPSVAINTSKTEICPAGSVTLEAMPTHGGSGASYSWSLNGQTIGTGARITVAGSDLSEGANTVSVTMTSTVECVSSPTASDSVSLTGLPDDTISTPANTSGSTCINTLMDPIVYSLGGGATGASVSGLPSGLGGTYSNGNYTISGTPSVAGTFNYTVTTSGSCASISASGTITVLPDATISLTSANAEQTVCQGEQISPITYSIGQTGTGAVTSGLPGGISGSFSNGTYTISGATNTSGTFPFTIEATGDCGNSQQLSGTLTITENKTPSVTITSSESDNEICAGTAVTFTATPVNGGSSPQFEWKVGTTSVATGSTWTTGDLENGQSVSVVMTSDLECVTVPTATSNAIVTTVNPNLTPSVTVSASDSDICAGDAVTFTAEVVNGGATPQYSWKIGGTSVSETSSVFTTSSLEDGQPVTVTITSNAACLATPTATSAPVEVLVKPNLTPEVTVTSSDADGLICSGTEVTFTAKPFNGGSSPSYQWMLNGSPVSTGSSTYTTNNLQDGDQVEVVMTSSEECLAVTTAKSGPLAMKVDTSLSSVAPAAISGPSAVCPVATGLVYSIPEIPGATSYQWDFPSGWSITSGAGTNKITVSASANAAAGMVKVQGLNECGPSPASTLDLSTGTVVVVDAGPDQTVCAGTTSVTLAGEIGGVIKNHNEWNWVISSGSISSSDENKLNATYQLPSSIINGGTVTVKMSSTDTYVDCGRKTDEMIITVLPQGTISDPANKQQTLCINTPISAISFDLSGAAKNATVSGLPAGVTGSFEAGVFTVQGTPTAAGIFDYTVATTGECSTLQTTRAGRLTVQPDPTITAPANKNQTVCINAPIAAIDFGFTAPASGATVAGLPAGVTGSVSGNTFTLKGSPTQSGTFEYTVTTTGECVQTTASGILTVEPDPTISDPVEKTQTVCVDTPITPVSFSVTAPATGATASGLPAGVNGSFANGKFTISGTPTESGEFTYTVNTTGSCVAATQTGTFNITPRPTATIAYTTAPFCSAESTAQAVSLTGTNAFEGGSFSAPAGLAINTATGAITPENSTPGTYTVTYTTPTSGGCPAVTATTDIIITPNPTAVISYDGPFCTSGNTAHPVNFSATVGAFEGGSFSAAPTGLDIDPGTGAITANSSNPGTYTVTYSIPASAGCAAVLVSTSVTITQNPEASISYNGPFCSADMTPYSVTFSATAGNYQNGTFSGSSGLAIDANGTVIPGNSTPGTHTVTYSIPGAEGCGTITATTALEIYKDPVITTQPSSVGICSTQPAEFSVVASGDQLSYQWFKDNNPITGATGPTLSFSNATATNAGDYHVVVSGAGACSAKTSETAALVVDENIIIIEPAAPVSECDQKLTDATFKFVAHAKGAPLSFTWLKDGNVLNLVDGKHVVQTSDPTGVDGRYTGTLTIKNVNPDDNGVYAVQIKGPDYFTCPDATSKTFTLDIKPLPDAPTTEAITYCQNETAAPLAATGENLKWYSYDSATDQYTFLGNSFTPPTDTPGTSSYWVTQTATCESTFAELPVTVLPTPETPVTAEVVQYCFEEPVSEPLSATGASNGVINWYTAADAITPMAAAPVPVTSTVGTTTYWVAQAINSCESARIPVTVNVTPLPQVAASSAENIICSGSSTVLTATGATTYSWFANDAQIGTGAEITVNPIVTTTYEVTGTDGNDCSTTASITVEVEEPTQGGVISGPNAVCIGANTGTLTLTGHVGAIQRWERSLDGTTWTPLEVTTDTLGFENLSEATSFRAIIKNGVCQEEPSSVHQVQVDPKPVAGGLLFKGTDQVFIMCEMPTAEYLVPLSTSGTYIGEIVAWQYRRSGQNQWSTIQGTNGNFTGTTLPGDKVITASNNVTTQFRVVVQSGACTEPVYSEMAVLSIVPSDIAPTPVEVTQNAICLGDTISLSSGTGYASGGDIVGGAFDNSSITNSGWRVRKLGSTTELNFESSADNIRPQHWLRVTPKEFPMFNHNTDQEIMQLFDSSADNEGNKGFAIVSGNNPSTLETPVFNTFGMKDATLTFDQAYNLYSPGSNIRVEVSTDGGQTYPDTIWQVTAPALSGNYSAFGGGTPETAPLNKIVINLDDYVGQENLRIRFVYDGSDKDIWTVDNIAFPDGANNVELIWYYDENLEDPNNELEQIGEVNQGTVQFTPTKIGWNDFEVQTTLIFDTNGDPCQSAENSKTIRVYAFDQYSTTASTNVGSCGSLSAQLSGTISGAHQGVVTGFPEGDESTVAWEVVEGPAGYTFSASHFENVDPDLPAVNDPNAVFKPGVEGQYTLRWVITPDEESTCTPQAENVIFNLQNCTALDFDGIDDYVLIENDFAGAQSIEVWVRPESLNGPGEGKVATVFSNQNVELFLNASGRPVLKYFGKTLTSNIALPLDGRWYHLAAVFNSGSAKLFIDGVEITDKTAGSANATGSGDQMIIGARFNGLDSLPDNHFSGWIEELRIWNTPITKEQIQFMMNQRLENNGSQIGVEIPMDVPGGLTYANLLGYYQLISANPDPLGIVAYVAAQMPANGLTPDLTGTSPGQLHNMTTNQENTAPLPYISATDGQQWMTDNTWIRPQVWDPPNSTALTGESIEWNIAVTNHDIASGSKNITLLGLRSETPGKEITVANPTDDMDEYNIGQKVRITHYLLLNGNMDLVGESQLLQDSGSILAEESAGWLERDQQGKRLSYNYNYWSSPVSAQGAANNAPYSVSQVLLDGTDSANPKAIHFSDQYAAADGGKSNPITISNYWIWKFLGTADAYEEWFHIGSTGTLQTGEGFTMKGTDGTAAIADQQNYVFKGKPHNGDFTRSVSADQNYLVGNPYPSAMDAREFILDNLADVTSGEDSGRNTKNVFNGAIYYWDHFAGRTHYLERYIGGYATWTLAGGTVAISNDERINANDAKGTKEPGRYIPVGQGFFVNTINNPALEEISGIRISGGEIQFKNSQRIYERELEGATSVFHMPEDRDKTTATKSSEDTRKKIWIKFSSPMGYHRQILVTADPETTKDFDLGYDAPLIENNVEDMYWYFNDYEFVIQAVQDFNPDRELPLGMKVHESGEFRISIDHLKNIPTDMNIYVKDSLRQVTHDLRKSDYVATSDTGTYHNRLKIVFKEPVAVIEEEDLPSETGGDLEILYLNAPREVLIKNPELLDISRVYLNNVLGQQLHVYIDIPVAKEVRLPVQRFPAGVYLLRIHAASGTQTKKIIIE